MALGSGTLAQVRDTFDASLYQRSRLEQYGDCMVSVCLPSDALLQHLLSYLGFSYLGRGVDLHDPDNHDGVITDLKPDILECEVKWALESITTNKASGGDGIPVELFQILKDDAVKVLHSICQQIWKTQQWPQDWKRSVFIPIRKKGNAKECSNYCTIALISHTRKKCSKFSKPGFNST